MSRLNNFVVSDQIFSSSSGCFGKAVLYYCDSPWAFHIYYAYHVLKLHMIGDLYQAITPEEVTKMWSEPGSKLNSYRLLILSKSLLLMSLVARKPVFAISDQVRHKPGCKTTEDG